MPSRRVHNYTCKLILGKSFDGVHAAMDLPVKWLGRRHRIMYHTPFEAAMIARRVSSDPRAVSAAMLHLRYDEMCSKDPKLRQMLEDMARRSARATHRDVQRPQFVSSYRTILGEMRPKPVRQRKSAFQSYLARISPRRTIIQRPPRLTISKLRKQILHSVFG
jgi:hypothetical protein